MINTLFKRLSDLSIDVAIGSSIMTMFFADLFRTVLPLPFFVLMSVFIWLVYTLDHLLDAKDLKTAANTSRHRFHQKYFKWLMPSWYVVFVTAVVFSLILLPKELVIGGLVIAMFVFVHFIFNKLFHLNEIKFFPKEFMIGVIYSGGVLFAPILGCGVNFNLSHLLIIVSFVLIVMSNLVVFSWFDKENDSRDGHKSIFSLFSDWVIKRLIMGFVFLSLSIDVVGCFLYKDLISGFLILLSMSLVFLFMIVAPDIFIKKDRFRYFGDGVFLFPLIILL